jgi:hypothetical protein
MVAPDLCRRAFLSVAAATAGPLLVSGQEPVKDSLSALRGSPQDAMKDIPERVLKAAERLGLDPSTIKLEGGQWVGCKSEGDECLLIEKALPEERAKAEQRSLAKREQSLIERSYTPEYLKELSDLIRTRRDITVVLVVSVPKYCKWCRVYAEDLQAAEKKYANRKDVTFAVVNFDTYGEATEKMGPLVVRFPFTSVFRPQPAIDVGRDRIDDGLPDPFLSKIGRDFNFFTGRRTVEQLQRIIEPPSAPQGMAR